MKTRELRHCIRLMKIALKTARVCIGNKELNSATKVLERAADYQDVLAREADGDRDGEVRLRDQLRVEYFAVRISLVSGHYAHLFSTWKSKSPFGGGITNLTC